MNTVSNEAQTRQRLRIIFTKDHEAKYISHLDTVRAWERALRRANLPLAYSKGYTPHPRMTFGAALPVGFTSNCEVLDVILERPVAPDRVARSLLRTLTPGLSARSVQEIPLRLPALQAQMRMAEYHVVIAARETSEELQARLDHLLAMPRLPRRRQKKGSFREYDLRPLIDDLWIESEGDDDHVLGMHLIVNSQATGRPDEVTDELSLAQNVRSIRRTRLIWIP